MTITQSAGLVAGVQSAQGIDVSNFQGQYDWKAAVAQIPDLRFGIYRLTQGLGGPGTNSPDPTAAHNHAAIRANGLHRGAYHFLDPRLDGAAQATYFVAEAQNLGIEPLDMFWLDNETAGGSPQQTALCAQAFMNELGRLLPHQPGGVYTFINFARDGYCAGLGKYPLWLAFPSSAAPVPPPPWLGRNFRFWQWGQRKGTDADAFMGTFAQLTAWLISFAAPPPPAEAMLVQLPGGQSRKVLSHDGGKTWA